MELGRREFMIAGTTSLLSLDGSLARQINTSADSDEFQFRGVADLIGPASARPAPDDPFFDDKLAYAYRYETTDGARYFISHDQNHWTQLMPFSDFATPYNSIKSAEQQTQFATNPSEGLTRRRYQWYSNNVRFDGALFTDSPKGFIEIATGASSAQTARINSALAGQYAAQSLAQPGMGMEVGDANISRTNGLSSLSHGTVATGVGWHDGSAGGWSVGGTIQTFLGLRLSPSGAEIVAVGNGTHLGNSPVAQENWNLDTMDGSGSGSNPSGRLYKPEQGYIYQFPYTWYGYGGLFVGITDRKQDELLLFHRFDIPQISFDRPDMPVTMIVDDDGTAADLSANFGGSQYALYGGNLGDESTEERGTDISRTEFSIDTASVDNNGSVDPVSEPGDPIVSVKTVDDARDLSIRIDNLFAEIDNSIWVFSWDEYEPAAALANENFRDPNEPVTPATETQVEIDTAATAYTPTQAVSRGIDYLTTQKNQESFEQLATDDRVPIDATRVITAAHDGTAATIDPAQMRVVEGY